MSDRSTGDGPWASCVMIFLDGERFIDEAIRSAVDQCGADDWELLLIDDGSTDASTAIAQRWAATDARIRYLDHPGHANLGMSASRNAGLAAARGTFVGFLDCDDVWLPGRLAHARRVSDAHPRADVIIGASYRWHGWTGDPDDIARDHRHVLPPLPSGQVLDPPRLFEAIYADPPWWNELAMCGLLIRTRVLRDLGGLEDAYRGLFEDQVLYVKLALGATAVIDPRPVALYRQHDDSTCARAIASGAWTPLGDSPPLRQFLAWLEGYVSGVAGAGSGAAAIARTNRDYDWSAAAGATWRAPGRRSTPGRRVARAVAARLRRRMPGIITNRRRSQRLTDRWSDDFLRPVLTEPRGRTLIVRSRWWPTVRHRGHYDTIVVSLTATRSSASPTARHVAERLAPGGRAYIVAPANAAAALSLRRALPDAVVTVEPFGNERTMDAIARATTVDEVPAVSADRADVENPVLHAITVQR